MNRWGGTQWNRLSTFLAKYSREPSCRGFIQKLENLVPLCSTFPGEAASVLVVDDEVSS